MKTHRLELFLRESVCETRALVERFFDNNSFKQNDITKPQSMATPKKIRKLAYDLVDTLCVIAYADTTEAFIRERQHELREEYGNLIPEGGLQLRGNIQDAYLRFMDVLNEEPENIGTTCEDILYDCLAKYM